MRIEHTHHHYYHNDPAQERKLDKILSTLEIIGRNIMSAISDFATKQTAFNDDVGAKLTVISADLDTVSTNVTALNALITQLQNSPGTITPADQATLDKLQAAGAALQTSADALGAKADALAGLKPPVVPTS